LFCPSGSKGELQKAETKEGKKKGVTPRSKKQRWNNPNGEVKKDFMGILLPLKRING